jgi:hypothetical protein
LLIFEDGKPSTPHASEARKAPKPSSVPELDIPELEGFVVEFRGEGDIVDEVIFHQPNGTFVAKRVEG